MNFYSDRYILIHKWIQSNTQIIYIYVYASHVHVSARQMWP